MVLLEHVGFGGRDRQVWLYFWDLRDGGGVCRRAKKSARVRGVPGARRGARVRLSSRASRTLASSDAAPGPDEEVEVEVAVEVREGRRAARARQYCPLSHY